VKESPTLFVCTKLEGGSHPEKQGESGVEKWAYKPNRKPKNRDPLPARGRETRKKRNGQSFSPVN